MDLTSVMAVSNGVGDDWAVFRCHRNPNTGKTAFQEQGALKALAAALPAVNTALRVTGFGTDGNEGLAGGNNAACTCKAANMTGRRDATQQNRHRFRVWYD